MSNTMKHWAPKSVAPSLSAALAVKYSGQQEMTPALHQQLLTDKVRKLFKEAGEARAQQAMEMSPEHLPELYAISQQAMPMELPQQLMASDTMMAALNQINWAEEASSKPLNNLQAGNLLQEQTLESLLEAL